MKFCIAFVGVILVVAQILQAKGNPLWDDGEQEPQQGSVTLVRSRRATCDLFSAFGVQDSLCAAHCLAKWMDGYRGGHCENGVCVCRK